MLDVFFRKVFYDLLLCKKNKNKTKNNNIERNCGELIVKYQQKFRGKKTSQLTRYSISLGLPSLSPTVLRCQ